MRKPLLDYCIRHDITGTLLLAEEGINGTIAGLAENIEAVLEYLSRDERLAGLDYKESVSDERPFFRMKVKLKKEIVTLGVEGIDPNLEVGRYVKPEQWNRLISDPEVVLIDTRNDYEVEIGRFKGAINPDTKHFREFPEFVRNELDPGKHKKVAMYCTGGIRCEKASAYLLQQGFAEVYHLEGGVLKYLEEVPEQQSLWQGECFVFDRRVAVNHRLESGSYEMCYACRRPVSDQDKQSEHYREGVSCPRCYTEYSEADRQRFEQRQRQIELAKAQDLHHVGISDAEFRQRRSEKKARQAALREKSRQKI